MNTTFNFNRFLKILGNEWRLTGKKVLLFWGILIIQAILSFFIFSNYGIPDVFHKKRTFMVLFFFMCILQGFYLQFYYREFSSKTKTQALLLLPASRNETFWAKFLLGIILYLIFFSAYIFMVVKWIGVHNEWILESNTFSLSDRRSVGVEHYQMLTFGISERLIMFFTWLFSASAYLFGILTFKKSAAFKSLAFFGAVIIGLLLIIRIIYFSFTGVWPKTAIPGFVISTGAGGYFDIVQMYPELLFGIGIFICLALIFISRVKYTEKTI